MISHVGKLHIKEKYLDMKYRSLEEETSMMLGKVNLILPAISNMTNPRIVNIIKNISDEYSQSKFTLKAPTIFNFLPHLSTNYLSLQPYYRFSKNRMGGTYTYFCHFINF